MAVPVVDYASNIWMHECNWKAAPAINRVQRIGAQAIVIAEAEVLEKGEDDVGRNFPNTKVQEILLHETAWSFAAGRTRMRGAVQTFLPTRQALHPKDAPLGPGYRIPDPDRLIVRAHQVSPGEKETTALV
jgi:hypothetical protein